MLADILQYYKIIINHLLGNAYIMVPPKNVTAREGEEVTLGCQAEGNSVYK